MKKTLITGAKGLVGSEIDGDVKIGREVNLIDPYQTDKMFEEHRQKLFDFLNKK